MKKDYFVRSCMYNRICVIGKKETILLPVDKLEQMDANMVAIAEDIREILRIDGEQRRLWEAYEEYEENKYR